MAKIKRKGERTLISREYRGPIEELPLKEYSKDLKKWGKKKKAKPHGKPVLFYYHPFDEIDEEKFRIDVAKPIKRLRKAGDGYKLKFLPHMKVAAKNFKGTPSEYAKVYEELYDWIEKKEYKPFGNRMEVVKKFPKDDKDEFKIKSQIQIPVEKSKKKR
ncbi:MAG: GyrI-like domain-containing protein [Candidatus Thermoplasmatota archaeon]